MDENNNQIPLGLCKQAVMKLDSFMNDINEILEDDDLTPENKLMFGEIKDLAGTMLAAIVNVTSREMNEDDFLAEVIDMDKIEEYPSDNTDPIDVEIK